MNVLSLFDGMSCGRVALERVGITVGNYFASEIDKYAMKVTKANYPDTKHIGDVTSVTCVDLPKIDLLIGGSPCQGFSFAGKQLNFDDPRSALFFEFVRILKETKPKYFLLENVRMKKEYQDIISKHLGVEPICINSSLVSGQNRVRFYWVGKRKTIGDYSDYLVYSAKNNGGEQNGKNRRVQGKAQTKGETKVLGKSQTRRKCMQSVWCSLPEDKQKRHHKDMFRRVPKGEQKATGQKQKQKEAGSLREGVQKEEKQGTCGVPTGLQKNTTREVSYEESGQEASFGEKGEVQAQNNASRECQEHKNDEDYRFVGFREEVQQLSGNRRPHTGSCCADKQRRRRRYLEFSGVMSEVQFHEARQLGLSFFTYVQANIEQPQDRGIVWGDVRENGVNEQCFYYTEKAMQWLGRHSRSKNKKLTVHADNDKMQMLEASHHKKYSSQRFFGIVDLPTDEHCVGAMRGRYVVNGKLQIKGLTKQFLEFRYDGKTNALTTVSKDNVVVPFTLPNRVPVEDFFFRYITPLECERLQCVDDGYTDHVSNTQRYKMLGNGWTVDVIAHILKNIVL